MKQVKEYEAYPLAWPAGYKRTQKVDRIRSKFGRRVEVEGANWKSFEDITLFQARDFLKKEVGRLGADDLVISTNMRTRADGDVYSNAAEPEDTGVAIYFKLKGVALCLCADQYKTVKENTYALAKGIEAIRGMGRWGISQMLERVFVGFKALPAPIQVRWWEILKVPRSAGIDAIRSAYRRAVMESHPDRAVDGPSGAGALHEVEAAWTAAKIEKGVSGA